MKLPLFQVDAFSHQVFGGNPAAVCPLDNWLPDALMQSIAAEINLSETAFFVKSGNAYELRWFTPLTEVDLCGHATLATAFVIFSEPDLARQSVVFNTRSGKLTVEKKGDWLYMDFPSMPPVADLVALDEALGVKPQAVLAAGAYHFAVLENEQQVRELKPDLDAVSRLERMAVIVTAPGGNCDFVSRVFGPKVGIPEDPVTGSAHCLLVPYWAARLHKQELFARQVSKRGGELGCKLNGDRVEIAGQAVMFLRGEINLPNGNY